MAMIAMYLLKFLLSVTYFQRGSSAYMACNIDLMMVMIMTKKNADELTEVVANGEYESNHGESDSLCYGGGLI